jgi:hypothetical protein
MSKIKSLMILTLLITLQLAFASTAYAQPDPFEPTYGSAVVDGNPATTATEWVLAPPPNGDFFVDMIRSGQVGGTPEGKLYLQYAPETSTLYVLALMDPNIAIVPSTAAQDAANDHMTSIKIDGNVKVCTDFSENDGTPPDFQYIYGEVDLNNDNDKIDKITYNYDWNKDGEIDLAEGEEFVVNEAEAYVGFEASFYLTPNVVHTIEIIHSNVIADEELQTASTLKADPPNILVTPEYFLGGLLALVACFAAFIAFKKLPTLLKNHL